MTFEQLNLGASVTRALKMEGYERPTAVQEQSIPLILRKNDVLACAQTGTGKTAAFALPILKLLEDGMNRSSKPVIEALILTPTRELAIQISESFSAYGRFTGIGHTVVFGGVPLNSQIRELKNGPRILVATPGRLLDLMSQGHVDLSQIGIFVLDEADRMLDMGFIHDVRKVIKCIPAKRQTLFFSATMPAEITTLANSILTAPVRIEVTPVSSTAEKIDQSVYQVTKKDKPSLLIHLLKNEELRNVLVFTRTKHGADKLVKTLNRTNISANAIHGNKSQNARQNALSAFKKGNIRILVATDIAARGIDVDDLKYVINYELPNIPETYVHRIGRTGRAGLSGTAVSFCDQEELPYLKDINKLTSQSIPLITDHPYALSLQDSQSKTDLPAKDSSFRGTANRPARNFGRRY